MIVVKAPPEMQMEVPDLSEVCGVGAAPPLQQGRGWGCGGCCCVCTVCHTSVVLGCLQGVV